MPDMDNCTCSTVCGPTTTLVSVVPIRSSTKNASLPISSSTLDYQKPISVKTMLLNKGAAQNAYLPKRMRYGLYARTTPGLETFASKKYTALQPTVALKQNCINQSLCADYLASPVTPFRYIPQTPIIPNKERYYHRWVI